LACDQPHPCDAIRLADALDEAREMVERLTFFQIQNKELREALERLASNEAFYVATADISEEVKMRLDYARAALKGVSESESTKNQEENDG
jgi:hypothetical protein